MTLSDAEYQHGVVDTSERAFSSPKYHTPKMAALARLLLLLLACTARASAATELSPEEAQEWRLRSGEFDWQQPEADARVRVVGRGARDASGALFFAGVKTVQARQTLFVAKLAAGSDTIAWTRAFGAAGDAAAAFVVVVDEPEAQALYVVGTTWGVMDDAAHALNGFGQFGGRDVVLLKLSLDGDKLWSRQVGHTCLYVWRISWRDGRAVFCSLGRRRTTLRTV